MKISEFIHKCDETFSKYDFEIKFGTFNEIVMIIHIHYAGKRYSLDRRITVDELRHSHGAIEYNLSYMWEELENLNESC